jgi:FkbM family methyltransferase
MKVQGVILTGIGDRVRINAEKNGGEFEPESFAVWCAMANPGAVMVDIGAYTGFYAIAAAQRGATVTAYEPNPVVHRRLKDNVAANNVRVTCVRKAVSDKVERRHFYTSHDMTSAGRFNRREDMHNRIDVDCEPLASEAKVTAIKIDVEGAELAVLIGADAIIQRDHPLVIAEALNEKAGDILIDHMAERGYSWRKADRKNIIFTAAISNDR